MYYTLRYSVSPYDPKLHQELEALGVEFIKVCPPVDVGQSYMRFVVEENAPNFSQIAPLLPEETHNAPEDMWPWRPDLPKDVSLTTTPNYTEKERLDAPWLSVFTTTIKGYPENYDTVDVGRCVRKINSKGYPAYYHTEQQEPIMLKRPVKWGNSSYFGMAFCPFFCSDRAVAILERSGLRGFRFGPVLRWSTKEPFDNIFQVFSEQPLPVDSIVPVRDVELESCPICGQKRLRYSGSKPLLGIRPELLDPQVDFYSSSEFTLQVVSQKAYRFLKEKKMCRGLNFIPLVSV